MEELAVGLGLIGSAEFFCAVARRELEAALRPGVTAAALGEDFLLAGALYAAALSLEAQSADGFTAGEFTLRPGEHGSAQAASLRRAAQAILQGQLVDEGFAFLGVKG